MKINGMNALEFIHPMRERWHVPGLAVGLSLREGQDYLCSGVRCLESGLAFDEDTLIPIGSVTKPFLAHAISPYVTEGLLAWDRPVRHYVSGLKFADASIENEATLADLLSMRTGLDGREECNPSMDRSHESIQSVAARLRPKENFRQTFVYSGFSIALAAMILESVAGRSWIDILTGDFHRLGIKDFAFSYNQAFRSSRLASGYRWAAGAFEPQPWPEEERDLVDPATSLCLSTRGLLRWLDAAAKDPQISTLFHPHILTRFPDVPLDFWPESYGLCWGLRNYRGHRMIYHRGSDWGFRSVVAIIPDSGIKISIVSNRHGNLLIHLLLNHLLDEILGHSPVPWEPLFETYARQTKQE